MNSHSINKILNNPLSCFKRAHYDCRGFLLRVPIVALFIISFNFGFSNAQQKFTASAPKSVAENQNFNLTLTLDNASGSNLRLPPMNDFTLVGGPSTSTNMQIMNGSVSQSESYTYVLRPKKQGTFKIGKASINVGGNQIESNDLTVNVTAPSSQPQNQNQNQGGNQNATSADLAKQIKGDVFVKVIVNKSSVYEGEMLTATFKLYFCRDLSGYSLNKSPNLDGFWNKEAELDPHRRPTVENVNGKRFTTIEILKYNLIPQRSGKLQIAPAEINTQVQVQVRNNSNDPFSNFFNMAQVENVPLTIKTDPVTINVKDLPSKGQPKDFAGAVGKFNIATSLSAKETKTDDPVTYTIRVSGEGNLNLIDAPKIVLPPGFEAYDPKVKENITGGSTGMTGSKEYDYLIIPRQPGDYKLSTNSFSYFDPASEKYITINSPEFPLKVTGQPSKNANAGTQGYTSKQDIALLGEDIHYIKTTVPAFNKNGTSFFGSAGFIALYGFPFLAFVGLIAFRRRNETLAADIAGSKRRRALRLAKKRLSHGDKHLTAGDKKNFYDEVVRAIWGYLGDKLNIDMAELSRDNVEDKLAARNVKPETIATLRKLLDTCELSLYAPASGDTEMKNNYSTALNLIADLEDEIKN